MRRRGLCRRDPRLLYMIVGDGPNRGPMTVECERRGVLDRFRFPGWIPHGEVPRYMNLADIVVMPSENEAMAFAYLETQACGRVLIASDIAATREVVDDGVNGLLVEVGDSAAMAEATLRAAADAGLRQAIGARARGFCVGVSVDARDRRLRSTLHHRGRRASRSTMSEVIVLMRRGTPTTKDTKGDEGYVQKGCKGQSPERAAGR